MMNSFESFDYSSWEQLNILHVTGISCWISAFISSIEIMGTHFSVKSLSICPYCVEL